MGCFTINGLLLCCATVVAQSHPMSPPGSYGFDSRVMFERRSADVLIQGVVIPRVQFSFENVRGLGLAFLSGPARGKSVSVLTIGTSDPDVYYALGPYGFAPPGDYREAAGLFKQGRIPGTPVARVLLIAGNAIMNYRDVSSYREQLLQGDVDPTRMRIYSHEVRLLQFFLTEAERAASPRLHVFMQARGAVSMRIALKLLSRFSDYAKKVELEVHLRPDSWYIEHYYIPSVFPFQPPEPMPSELVFRLAPTLDCTKLGTGKVSCLGSNFEP